MKKTTALLLAVLLVGFALAGCMAFSPLHREAARAEDVLPMPSPASPAQAPKSTFPEPEAKKPTDAVTFGNSEELAWEEGDDGNYMYTDQAKFCGFWHASPFVGSGYSARYLLDVDGTFIYGCNEMDGLDRMRYASGNWYIDGNSLCLEIWERVVWEGGKEVVADGSIATSRMIENPKVRHISYDEAELETRDIAESEPDKETGKSVIMIDSMAFYSFDGQTDLLNGFWEMMELAE